MDTITHMVAGALTPLAFKNAPKTRMLTLFGIVCGEFPDIDILAGKSPEALLSFHRGITHAIVMQPVFAFVLALAFHWSLKKSDTKGEWTFARTWSVALLALLIHLFLDCMTTFGTQIFLPFSGYRVALPAMYIIDLAMTLPLLALWFILLKRGGNATPDEKRTFPARAGLVWILCYPLLCLGINYAATASLAERYAAQGNALGISRIELSPEPFAPLNWKVVGVADGEYHMARLFVPSPGNLLHFTPYPRLSPSLWRKLCETEPLFRIYDNFTTYPVQGDFQEQDGTTVYTFRDVRYEATLPRLMKRVGRDDGIFLMQVRMAPGGELLAHRFLHRGRDAAATPWKPFANATPAQPEPTL